MTDMGILHGKTVLITGVLTDQSIAFHVARLAQEEGAGVVLTSFGRALSLTRRTASRLPSDAPVVELDVTSGEDLDSLAERVRQEAGMTSLDGVLHSIGFAPESALGGRFLTTPWEDVRTALEVSAYSLKSLAVACRPLLGSGSSIVGWDLADPGPAARACVALMSDWFPATTGEIVHVDGGVHSQGA